MASELPSALLELWPKAFSFFLSFWIIGSYWLVHHRIFHYIRAYDRWLLLINLLFLMWIVLIPFSSALIGEYDNSRPASIIYAAHNTVAGLTSSWLWWHASKDARLIKINLDPRRVRYNILRTLLIPTIFVASIGISFISVEVARIFWLLTFLTGPILLRYVHRFPTG